MKICEYCRTTSPDGVLQCNSCGSKELKNICSNCNSEYNDSKCPVCSMKEEAKPRACTHCGKETFENVCLDCREELTNRRQVHNNNEHNNYENASMPKPKKKRKFLVFYILFLIGIGIIGSIVISNDENLSQEAALRKLPDMELLTLEGHPKFYDEYKEAKQFWRGFKKVKVVDASQTRFNENALLLITSGYSDKGVITNITINLSNVDNKKDIKLDDVLRLICDYIPYDIINKYYTFEKSFHEVYKDNSYEAYHYVMVLNEEGKKSGERYYKGKFAFKIIHRNDDDWIAEMNYLAYEGNHDKFGLKYYDVEDWDVDINKYSNEQ